MYSHEIETLLKLKNYLLTAKEYINICDSSNQIKYIKYDPFEDVFYINTKDNYNFKFKIKD